jgi:hypothetical protein
MLFFLKTTSDSASLNSAHGPGRDKGEVCRSSPLALWYERFGVFDFPGVILDGLTLPGRILTWQSG